MYSAVVQKNSNFFGFHLPFSTDSSFQLTVKDTATCLFDMCVSLRWTTGNRLMVEWSDKCLGAEGKTVGSGVTLYECDEKSELQKWECRNETVLALKDHELYIEVKEGNRVALSGTMGPNNHLVISGTSSGACSRTYRGTAIWELLD